MGNVSNSSYDKKGFLQARLTANGCLYELKDKDFSAPFQITGPCKHIAAFLLYLFNNEIIQESKKGRPNASRLIIKENEDESITVFVFKNFEQIQGSILGLSDTMTCLARKRFPQQQELENQLADAILSAGFPEECSTSLFKWILRLCDKSCETLTDHEGTIDLCGDDIKAEVYTTITDIAQILLSKHSVKVNKTNYQTYLKNLTKKTLLLLQDHYATFLLDSTSTSGIPDVTQKDIQCENALMHLLQTGQLHRLTRDIVQKIGKGKPLAAEPLAAELLLPPTDDMSTGTPVRTPDWDQDAEIVPIMDAYVEKLQTLAATKEDGESAAFSAKLQKILKNEPKQKVVPGEAVGGSSMTGASGQTGGSKS